MFEILGRYGISPLFIERIHILYDNAYASVQMNGILTGHIPLQCAVRHGYLLSMVLCTLCLHPLLRTLENKLTGIHIRDTERSSPVVACADYVTVLVKSRRISPQSYSPSDSMRERQEQDSTNINRKLLRLGTRASAAVLGIDFQEQITILGVKFKSTICTSIKASWDNIVRAVRAQARAACARDLCLAKKIEYVQMYLLSAIWYGAQTDPRQQPMSNR